MLVLNWVNTKEKKKTNENLICNSIQTMIFDHRRQADYPSQYDLMKVVSIKNINDFTEYAEM